MLAWFDATLPLTSAENGQWPSMHNRNIAFPSWLQSGFLPWSNCVQSWQVNLLYHTLVAFHKPGDGLSPLMGTCYFNVFQVVAAQLAKKLFLMKKRIWLLYLILLTDMALLLIYFCITLVVLPVNFWSDDNTVGFRPLQSPPGGGGAPQSCWLFYACNIPDTLRLWISAVFHWCSQVANPLS